MREARRARQSDPAQLLLFGAPAEPASLAHPVAAKDHRLSLRCDRAEPAAAPPRRRSGASQKKKAEISTITIEDMPAYPDALVEAVDRSLAELPATRAWFTYRQIQECFAISRATVARRVKEGLVPGVRFQNGRVLEDGSVRRFDRTQLRRLLLAVRSGPERVRHTAVGASLKQ